MHWDEIEELWLEYLKLRFSWIPILFSTGTLWFLASLVFIWGYVHKKRKSPRKNASMGTGGDPVGWKRKRHVISTPLKVFMLENKVILHIKYSCENKTPADGRILFIITGDML